MVTVSIVTVVMRLISGNSGKLHPERLYLLFLNIISVDLALLNFRLFICPLSNMIEFSSFQLGITGRYCDNLRTCQR